MKPYFLLTLLILFSIATPKAHAQEQKTIKEYLDFFQQKEDVNFVYNAEIKLDIPYRGASIQHLELGSALNKLLTPNHIRWEIRGQHILLFSTKQSRNKYTISGYVVDRNKESLINATILELGQYQGTQSNAYGFFSITLPKGKHNIRFSFVGCKTQIHSFELLRDTFVNVVLEEGELLDEVVVMGNLNSPVNTTQTGKVSISPQQLNNGYALFSSPDLIKTLQNIPGVAPGTDLISGLFVRGGTSDGNLFLLDGTPLYQVNHVGGLFSSFNTDVIKNVDFYKSGFPARYGGRTSSVIDVRTRDGNAKEYHGLFSIGLLDGRALIEGPIIKDRTSFIVGMRRSWADALMAMACGITNLSQDETKLLTRFAFYDLNAKITHKFSDRSKAYLSFYSGNDALKTRADQYFNYNVDSREEYQTRSKFSWGNHTVSANWNYQLSSKLFSNFSLVYSRNNSLLRYSEASLHFDGDNTTESSFKLTDTWKSTIDDIGYRVEFDYRPNQKHYIRFGTNYLHHIYKPHGSSNFSAFNDSIVSDTLLTANAHKYIGNELAIYVEDDIQLTERFKANIGAYFALYNVSGKSYHSIEPRIALKYLCSKRTAIKVSYTEMSQFVHQLASTYLNLPSDFWVPSTRNVKPSHSRMISAGIYSELTPQLHLDIEGYYKTLDHLLEYNGGNSLIPDAQNWENLVTSGKGRSYGLELAMSYTAQNFSANGSYTLSWSERKFDELYKYWYPDKYDNRHRLSISAHYQFNKKIDAYAGWTYRTGNKVTIPTQMINGPLIPGVPGTTAPQWVYEMPNNATLPNYHRLDIGVNFRSKTKRGHERIWNLSVYNAYCRINPIFVNVEPNLGGGFKAKAVGVFPILPSASYTLKF